MVGSVSKVIYDVITEKQLHHILNQATGSEEWRLIDQQMKPASEGLVGFLGDHFKATLEVNVDEEVKKVRLFVKCLPLTNEAKAKFIDELDFFRRETMMFQLFEHLGGDDGPNPWHVKAYLHNDKMLVMPDLSVEGYAPQPYYDTLDLPHVLLVASSAARFHASYSNYAMKKSINGKRFNILDEFGDTLTEPTFYDTPWLRACVKTSANILKAFSSKYNDVPNIEDTLRSLYIEGCDTFKDYPETLNVILHRDLWANNIMFHHENGVPTNAILVDYQCVRYGPPAFDLAMMLYLTTSKSFRDQNEITVLKHYFKIFYDHLEDSTKEYLKEIGYNFAELVRWFGKARMFGLVISMSIFPFVLMDPMSAARVYDDPVTYERYMNEDRSEPVLQQCYQSEYFRERQVEVTEEFVDRFVRKL